MVLNPGFEIVEIANEYIAVPVGKQAGFMKGVVALNDATAFLLKNMKQQVTTDELVQLLIREYDTDEKTAMNDIESIVKQLVEIGVIIP